MSWMGQLQDQFFVGAHTFFVGAHTFNQYQVIYVGPKGLLSITVGDCFCQC